MSPVRSERRPPVAAAPISKRPPRKTEPLRDIIRDFLVLAIGVVIIAAGTVAWIHRLWP